MKTGYEYSESVRDLIRKQTMKDQFVKKMQTIGDKKRNLTKIGTFELNNQETGFKKTDSKNTFGRLGTLMKIGMKRGTSEPAPLSKEESDKDDDVLDSLIAPMTTQQLRALSTLRKTKPGENPLESIQSDSDFETSSIS